MKLFVDSIEAKRATLLAGRRKFVVDAALLPRGVREGDWIVIQKIAAPRSARVRRRSDDDGGDFSL